MDAPEYNPDIPTGWDPETETVGEQFAGFEFHYLYLIICAFLVWLIIPGVSLLYSGLARRKSATALLFQSFMVTGIVTFQWMFWGFSLAFSRTGSPFIGNLDNFGLINTFIAPSNGSSYLPDLVFCLYQMFFCMVTVNLVLGGSFERGHLLPSLIFAFCWATIVYCPIANWTWNPNGWLANLGALDFAGGGPVHQSSGWSALAYALMLGRRKGTPYKTKPHNATLIFIGTVLIWFGWYGFNGGSALNGGMRSMLAAFNTNTAAAFGVIGWTLVDTIRSKGKFSMIGACEGAVAGLVGITPAAGFVSPWLGGLIGFVAGIVCSAASNLNQYIGIDEGLDVFCLHGIGGMLGSFLTGIFAQSWVGAMDDLVVAGSIDGNGIQIGYQLAEICAVGAWAFTVTCVLLLPFKYIPFLKLRVSEEAEEKGLDHYHFRDEQIGDWSYFEENKPTIHGLPVGNPACAHGSDGSSRGSIHKEDRSAPATTLTLQTV